MITKAPVALILLSFACSGSGGSELLQTAGAPGNGGGNSGGAENTAGAGAVAGADGGAGTTTGGSSAAEKGGSAGAPSAGSSGAAQGGSSAKGGSAGAASGGSADVSCEVERQKFEAKMRAALEAAAADPSITSIPDFTLALEADDGHRFVYSHGDSSLDTSYESASTSKWVSAAVILDLVDQGQLKLDDQASKYLPFWKAEGVTLASLLSFTSGFSEEPLCFNSPNADFADCVAKAYDANAAKAPQPGSVFHYSSTHLQVAGLMAVRAAGVNGWGDLFADFQARTSLFRSATYDLPSRDNPRLAGGMHWTGAEYLEFLRAIYDGKLLHAATRTAMLANQRGAALVKSSPTIEALNQDWAYGFGNWLECPGAVGPNTFDCGAGHRNSSPGAYGAYPFIDFDHRYIGILARQGKLGTFREGDALFGVVTSDAAHWADACPGG